MTAITATSTAAELQALAEQAVTWAYPLYEMRRMRAATSPRRTEAGQAAPEGMRWCNLFTHARQLLRAGTSRVVTPNNDTLYTNAWLDLGAGPLTIIRTIIIPHAMPGIVSGAIVVFMLSLGNYLTPNLMGGKNSLWFTEQIYNQFIAGFNWNLGAAFGFLVALMGCYHGMNSGRGAQGVGKATKSAVVSASVLIFAAYYLLTELFFS